MNSFSFFILTYFIFNSSYARTVEASFKEVQSRKEFIEITESMYVVIDLRYATTKNLLNENMYGVFNKPYVHQIAAEKLLKAIRILGKTHPGYKLVIFDALRPRSVQAKLWDKVKGTSAEKYVANPINGSMHNYGLALDLSIVDEKGQELDMGTAFDATTELSQPILELKFFKAGRLTQTQLDHRQILRNAMVGAGFTQLPHEWWHYDALPKPDVKKNYRILE